MSREELEKRATRLSKKAGIPVPPYRMMKDKDIEEYIRNLKRVGGVSE